jgi:hypothetical protein
MNELLPAEVFEAACRLLDRPGGDRVERRHSA